MKIIFAAGGTAGHVNPALSVAQYVRAHMPETEILFVGTENRIESKIVPQAGFKYTGLDVTGFKRGFGLKDIRFNAGTVAKLMKSQRKIKRLILDFSPDLVLGFGGYVSGPVLRMAAKLGIRTATHEQNAFPGMTTKALAKYVDVVMLTAPDAERYLKCKNKPVVTGLPVRADIITADKDFSRAELKLDSRPLILSFGGSLGAEKVNDAIYGLMNLNKGKRLCHYIHATGRYGVDEGKEAVKKFSLEGDPDIEIREYINDMSRCMAAADIVICRAGASTISELQVLGKPSILIPSPNVTENHQFHNAMALVNAGAALIIEEKDLTPERLCDTVNSLLSDKDRLKSISENAKAMAITDAAERICEAVFSGMSK